MRDDPDFLDSKRNSRIDKQFVIDTKKAGVRPRVASTPTSKSLKVTMLSSVMLTDNERSTAGSHHTGLATAMLVTPAPTVPTESANDGYPPEHPLRLYADSMLESLSTRGADRLGLCRAAVGTGKEAQVRVGCPPCREKKKACDQIAQGGAICSDCSSPASRPRFCDGCFSSRSLCVVETDEISCARCFKEDPECPDSLERR